MNEVNIYIDTYHTGNLKTGKGTYSIVLECFNSKGEPVTREYIGGIDNTTKNRTSIIACITAFEHILKPCEIKVLTNSMYIVQAIDNLYKWLSTETNAKGKPVKNLDLWQQLYDLLRAHKVSFQYAESNQYTSYMSTMIKKADVIYKSDIKC